MRRKVLKVIPVWLMLIVTIGTAAAAFTWISNQIRTTVTVTAIPITISGTFAESAMTEFEIAQLFTYSINSKSLTSPVGYVLITFDNGPTSVDDISCAMVVNTMGPTGLVGVLQDGYPFLDPGTLELRFLFGLGVGVPYDFGVFGSTAGEIVVWITYHIGGQIYATIQVTSTLS